MSAPGELRERLVAGAFAATGLLNLYPSVGALGVPQLTALYGVPIESADLQLLLRHRAVLLGIVGALLVAATWSRPLRMAAGLAGVASMASFLVLALPPSAHGTSIAKVFRADVVGMVVLLAAVAAELRRYPPSRLRLRPYSR